MGDSRTQWEGNPDSFAGRCLTVLLGVPHFLFADAMEDHGSFVLIEPIRVTRVPLEGKARSQINLQTTFRDLAMPCYPWPGWNRTRWSFHFAQFGHFVWLFPDHRPVCSFPLSSPGVEA